MRLEKCKKHRYTFLRVSCCNCNNSEYIEDTYADLDGEPFNAYYCNGCKNNIESAILDEQQELLRKK